LVLFREDRTAIENKIALPVDDDPSVLRALSRLIRIAGFSVLAFDRASALIASAIPKADACLIVDLNLPEMNGSDCVVRFSIRARPACPSKD